MPLDIRLLYESGTAVGAQDILRLFPALRPNMSRGRATISFRIDDVSKNHQGQSFVLEVAPETQESSLMFQDIAPVRTSAIAIRSKRNKRKLQAARPSPRSVAGTPRANLVTLAPPTAQPAPMMMMMPVTTGPSAVGPPPAQRQRRMLVHGTPTNTQYAMLSHQPGSGRAADMAMAAQQQQSVSWSSHMHHQPQQTQQTPMHQPTQQAQPTPMASPTASAAVEWKLAGFEIHPDGTQNVACPIYRCPHCKRLHDVEAMSSGMAEHSPQCVFSSLLYRSQLEAAQQQQQLQQQMHMAQYQQQQSQAQTPMSRAGINPSTASSSMPPLDTDLLVPGAYAVETPSDASPKTLAMMHQRLGQATISPFMNRAPSTDDNLSDDTTAQGASSSNQSNQGNLFASHAFRSHMAISEDPSGLDAKPESDGPESTDPLGGVASNNNDDRSSSNNSNSLATQLAMDDSAVTLSVGVGTALFHEMSSMGISLEEFNKSSGGFTPLGDFSGLGDEDQVFYILARMYTDAQNRKLGLPAFDQFQRMVGFYTEAQNDAQTQVLFHALEDVGVPEKEQVDITNRFTLELQQHSDAVHSLPKYQHNLIMLREDALMYYWSQSLQTFGVN